MYKILLVLLIFSVILSTGCMKKSGNSDELIATIDNSAEISQVEQLAPEREKIKSDIFDNIKTKLNVSKSNKTFAPNYGNYYFVLSKKITVVNGNTATITYQFIYIENYGTSSAVTWQGSIIYTYQKQTSPIIRWILTDITVTFGQVNTGSIIGTVVNKITGQPLKNVDIYAKSNEEQTKYVKTDNNGNFTIPDVLENTYTVFALLYEFDITKKENIVVSSGNTTNIGTIELIPSEDTRFATIQGYVYYDSAKTRPVSSAAIKIENPDGSSTDFLSATTDETGKYEIPFITEGNYLIWARIENLASNTGMPVSVSSDQISISETINVNDIILENNIPIINSYAPATPYIAQSAEEITFSVSASDADNDLLYYDWSATDGDLGFSTNNTVIWTAPTSGTNIEVYCKVYDKKGGSVTQTWNINVQESLPVSDTATNLLPLAFSVIKKDGLFKAWNPELATYFESLDGISWTSTALTLNGGNFGNPGGNHWSSTLFNDEQNKYMMFLSNSTYALNMLTSNDGIDWQITGSNITSYCQHPSVMLEDGQYKMWYHNDNGDISTSKEIAYRTSYDGINWTEPIFTNGFNVIAPRVVKVGSQYKLFCHNRDVLLVYESSDGLNWTIDNTITDLPTVPQISFDIIYDGAMWHLWRSTSVSTVTYRSW